MKSKYLVPVLCIACAAQHLFAQRQLKNIPDPSPDLQREQFELADGFEINLFASDPQLAKPIQMNFDARGRLWVASSEVYPQIEPGQVANDKVLILDDRNSDGTADSTVVFAEGLLIPTGVLPGDGGCYVANSTELLHMADTDDDGKADNARVVLSGFGTEDTHHILHTLRWGPGCSLYMNQSIYIHSHIETPHGVRRMNGGGTWWFRPDIMRLETYTLGCCNPWGHAWNRYGVSFGTDGAYGEGINYYFPGFVGPTSPGARRVVNGLNSGKPKLCSLEFIDGTHLPEDWRGNFIANDFRAHRVCRYIVDETDTAYSSTEGEELVKTRHVAFRPIDVKMGPDGAIYIADWYNPIIQHGEVDFRDERRDHTHGRIWRITAKGRPLVPRINLEELATDELCEMLASPEPWRVQNAKQVLKHRDRAEVHDNLNRWLAKQDHTSDDYYRRMLQVFWASEAQGVIRHDLLNLLLKCRDPQAKASATRALFHWHDSIPNADEWIELLVNDSHARVRLEAVRAATKMKYPDACQIAMRALDHPVDRFLDFALWTAARDLKSTWVPGLDAGEIDFDGDPNHLIFALKAIEEPNVANRLLALASNTDLSADLRRDILRTVAETSANGNELQQLFDLCLQPSTDGETRNAVLAALVDAAKNRRLKPSGDLNALATLLQRSGGGTADIENVLRLAGLWRISSLRSELFNIAAQAKRDGNVIASLDGLAAYGDELAMKMLSEFAAGHSETVFRSAAAARTMLVDANAGSRIVAQRLVASLENDDPSEMIRLTLRTKKGPDLLATALAGKSVHPEVARSALNELGSSGLTATSLTSALRKAGGLEMRRGWVMSDAERLAFLAEVEAKGYPAAGERIFRRSKMACQKCHAIGGAGGQVGPDLASIGASAQADYILESLVEPNKKIKENYHSLIIVDQDGQVFTGIKIRETNDSLLLRTAENQILNIPLKSIDERADGGSLMPAGLADTLTRSELVDLVRYLSELGKIGRYALPREKYARTWRTLSNDERKQKSVETLLASPASDWTDRFSAIDGALPTNDLPALSVGDQRVSVVKCSISLDNPVGFLKITPHSGVHVWMNGNEVADHANLTVPNGEHEVVLVIDRAKSIPNVSIQISN